MLSCVIWSLSLHIGFSPIPDGGWGYKLGLLQGRTMSCMTHTWITRVWWYWWNTYSSLHSPGLNLAVLSAELAPIDQTKAGCFFLLRNAAALKQSVARVHWSECHPQLFTDTRPTSLCSPTASAVLSRRSKWETGWGMIASLPTLRLASVIRSRMTGL